MFNSTHKALTHAVSAAVRGSSVRNFGSPRNFSALQRHTVFPTPRVSQRVACAGSAAVRASSTFGQDEPARMPAPARPDFYAVLGVERNASVDDIKAAFRGQGAYARVYSTLTNLLTHSMNIFRGVDVCALSVCSEALPS